MGCDGTCRKGGGRSHGRPYHDPVPLGWDVSEASTLARSMTDGCHTRNSLMDRLTRAGTPVVELTGHAGVGKSHLFSTLSLAIRDSHPDALIVGPRLRDLRGVPMYVVRDDPSILGTTLRIVRGSRVQWRYMPRYALGWLRIQAVLGGGRNGRRFTLLDEGLFQKLRALLGSRGSLEDIRSDLERCHVPDIVVHCTCSPDSLMKNLSTRERSLDLGEARDRLAASRRLLEQWVSSVPAWRKRVEILNVRTDLE